MKTIGMVWVAAAARAIGLTEVPTITLSGLSEVQKRALRIADNKIALNAGWDLEILQLELGELASIDVDIDPTLTGFSTGEIDVILSSADPDDEVIPPLPVPAEVCERNKKRWRIGLPGACEHW
jgi:ParB-like chromosome segregation protein Spo0J